MSEPVVEAVTRAIEKTSRVVNDYGTPLLDNPEECARAAISVVIEECAKVVEAQYQTGDHELGHFLNAAAAKIRNLKSAPGEKK